MYYHIQPAVDRAGTDVDAVARANAVIQAGLLRVASTVIAGLVSEGKIKVVAAFYKVEPADVLVVVDEVQLPLGKLRLRVSGSDGGHNGLKSLIENLGFDFPRLRIGVERGDRQNES